MNGKINDQPEIKEIEKVKESNYIKAQNMLKDNFKSLYGNAGMEWTEEKDKEIDFIFDSIYHKIAHDLMRDIGEILIKINSPKY
ncbi:MAG: hypothetical protein ACLQG5_03820 [Methanobacterium sp.]|jgi:hypothetical protein